MPLWADPEDPAQVRHNGYQQFNSWIQLDDSAYVSQHAVQAASAGIAADSIPSLDRPPPPIAASRAPCAAIQAAANAANRELFTYLPEWIGIAYGQDGTR